MISGQTKNSVDWIVRRAVAGVALMCCMAGGQTAFAQFGFGFGNGFGVVGGISIDADGTVRNASVEERSGWLQEMRRAAALPAADMAAGCELRMVSLSKLQAELQKAIDQDRPIAEEMQYLAGLQRVEYIFVYPESQDIVLAGPAEGWIVREDASVVGKTSGRPVLQLEDLLTALRTSRASQKQPISVSIDPTPEGELRLNRLLSQIRPGRWF